MSDKIKIDLTPALRKIGALVKEEAIRRCPTDMGELRRSIDYRIDGNKVIITASADYAEDMEYGRPPEPLSAKEKQDIEGWARRHGLDSGKGVIIGIQKRGIKVGTAKNPLHVTSLGRDSYRPFLRPSVYQNLPEIRKIIRENLKGV